MESMFTALIELLKTPLRHDRGVKTDSSVLLIYPPDRELDFREHLLDTFVPELDAKNIQYRLLDLSGFLFSGLSEEQIESLPGGRVRGLPLDEAGTLQASRGNSSGPPLTEEAAKVPGGNVFVYATVALHPVVRYGEVLRGLRDL